MWPGEDLAEARVSDLVECGVIWLYVPDLFGFDHTARLRSARSGIPRFFRIGSNQRFDNELSVPAAANGVGKVSRWEWLGGLLNFHYRETA